MSKALDDIAAERRRQIEAEGWTPEHDDEHADEQLALAAMAYIDFACLPPLTRQLRIDRAMVPGMWPWDRQWWKPKTVRQDLVRAAALIAAEIERLDRAALKAASGEQTDAV